MTELRNRLWKRAKEIYAESDKCGESHKASNLRVKLIKQEPEKEQYMVRHWVTMIAKKRSQKGMRKTNGYNG